MRCLFFILFSVLSLQLIVELTHGDASFNYLKHAYQLKLKYYLKVIIDIIWHFD